MSETTSNPGSATPQFRVDDNAQPFRLGPRPAASGLDGNLLDQTRNQIRELVDEIAALAKSGCSQATFFEGFLTRTTSALASSGGVVWTRPATDGPLEIAFHINFNQTVLASNEAAQAQHTQLLQRVLAAPEPLLVPPDTASDNHPEGNPTPFLLILAPLRIDQQLVGLVEIFQRPGGGPATQRGYLRFLAQMADLASDFLKSRRLEEFSAQQQLWTELQQFSEAVHASLDPDQVAFAIVNEGRRIIGCDRVAVSLAQGKQQQIVAVSGLDSIERRAAEIKRLAELATAVGKGRESLWHPANAQPLAPQIEQPLQAYLDQSHGRAVAIIPWSAQQSGQSDDPRSPTPAAAPSATLILEQLSHSGFSPEQRHRAALLRPAAESALANALQVDRLPFRRALSAIGQWTAPLAAERLTRTTLWLAASLSVVAVLWLLPWPFALGAKGKLSPIDRQEVYAAVNGTLLEVLEPDSPDSLVPEGAVLAQMSNHELQLQRERLTGELAKIEVQISNLNHQQLEKTRGNNREQERRDRFYLESELAKATALRESIREELEIVEGQVAALTIRNPISGHLVDWQIRRQLLGRPVNRGDRLMSVVPPSSEFEVELLLPEKRVGHLLAAVKASEEPLSVHLTLASQPELPLRGKIHEVDQVLAPHDGEGNALRILVRFDNTTSVTAPLRSGTRVTARIECGSQPLGYVLFHELIETLRGGWKLWF
ncbi:MAG: efflux RND transporter periplasmic adaptor subunit [Planctomycetota bacterium]